eukprot:SAG31_NODE_420_length_15868_cov_11.896823_1_plen_80_part_00
MAELIADSRLADELAVGKGSIVAFVGGGGKTSLMFALARQLCGAGLRVLCTTTTKMMKPRVPEVHSLAGRTPKLHRRQK